MLTKVLALPLLLLAPFAVAGSSHQGGLGKRSHRRLDKAPQEERDTSVNHDSTLTKRQTFNGRGTFYYTGLGACGQYSKDSDYMVALNSAQYGGGYPGPQCFKNIVIQANGVTVGGVTIMDECPTCDYGGLDLSPALFRRFADEGAGVINVNWWFEGSAPAPAPTSTSHWVAPTSTWTPPTSTWTPPTSTWSPPPEPTSTWTPPSSSSMWIAPSSSSTTPPPSSSSSTSSYVPSSSSFSSSASASVNASVNPFAVVASYNGTASATSASISVSASGVAGAAASGVAAGGVAGVVSNGNNLEALNGLVANYGQLIVIGAQSG